MAGDMIEYHTDAMGPFSSDTTVESAVTEEFPESSDIVVETADGGYLNNSCRVKVLRRLQDGRVVVNEKPFFCDLDECKLNAERNRTVHTKTAKATMMQQLTDKAQEEFNRFVCSI